jgi:hypothetical protein
MTPDEQPPAGGLPALVLHAARDIAGVETAFDAEMLLSTLLGSVYAAVLPDRGVAAESFVWALYEHLAGSGETTTVPLVTAVLDSLTGRAPQPPPGAPNWATELGKVTVTGCYAYGDRYGDQTSYVATFAYSDEALGGPEHAVAVLADHNLGLAKDLFIVAPAAGLIAQLRDDVATEASAMSWFSEIEPSTVRAAAMAYLSCTDNAPDLPGGDSLPANRALALARIALLPAPDSTAPAAADSATARAGLIEAFLASPEAELAGLAERTGEARESLTYCLGLIVDFATARGDALRWSPAGVETFLTSWVHERAILDANDAITLPDALRAWITWAGHRVDLPDVALQETMSAVRATRAEFARLHATGERQSPGARAMTALVADGVDLTDPAAVEAWLSTYNDSQG